jgi:hypothetical protein
MGVNKSRRPILAPQGTESVIPGVDTDAFADLTDGAGDMSAAGDKIVKVNAGGTALEYDDPAAGVVDFELTEVDTGRLWIDGDPVYETVIAFAAGPNNEQITGAHGVVALRTIISLTGILEAGDVHRSLPNADTSDVGESIDLAGGLTVIWLTSASNYSTYSGHVIMQYTRDPS